MQYVYIVVMGLHVMAGVFWAGTTITLARDPEIRAERCLRPQMGAAPAVFLTGALLWYFFHGAYFGSTETVLALGILAALAAAGVSGRGGWFAQPANCRLRLQPCIPCCAPE